VIRRPRNFAPLVTPPADIHGTTIKHTEFPKCETPGPK